MENVKLFLQTVSLLIHTENVLNVHGVTTLTKAENVKLFLLTALPLIFTENVHNVRLVTTWTKDAPVYPTTVEKPTALENALNV